MVWREVTVDEIKASSTNALATGPFGSSISARFFQNHGIPVIRGSNLSENISERLIHNNLVFLSDEKAREFQRSLARRGDLVFTCWGTIGQVGLIDDRCLFDTYIVSNKQMKLTPDPTIANSLYLYYLFSSPAILGKIKDQAIGSSVPGFNLGQLRSIRFPLPPLSEQNAIARILGALDDKIELNRRMNETLEATAQALFKSWFVDFDPVRAKAEKRQPAGMDAETAALFPSSFEESPHGLIPKGWRVKSLDEVAHFLNGLALQKFPPIGKDDLPVIKIAELRKGITETSGRASSAIDAKYIIEDGDVLFSWSGSLEVVVWCGGRGALNQHLFKVTSADYPKWFYFHWVKEHLPDFQAIAAGKATTMGHIQRHHLKAALVVVPPANLLKALDKAMMPLMERVVSSNLESRTLAALRDALLPKLLSGEIRVREAEREVGQVA